MPAGNSSEVIAAFNSVDDSFSVPAVLDLLYRSRVEVFVDLMSVDRILVFDKGICIGIWKP